MVRFMLVDSAVLFYYHFLIDYFVFRPTYIIFATETRFVTING